MNNINNRTAWMDAFEERLTEEVRRFKHLYDTTSPLYKTHDATVNSWREIGTALGRDPQVCLKRWKALRDRYVRMKKKLKGRSGDPGGQKIPPFYTVLSWLSGYIKHRDAESNMFDSEDENEHKNSISHLQSCSTPRPSPLPCQPSYALSPSPARSQPNSTPTPSPPRSHGEGSVTPGHPPDSQSARRCSGPAQALGPVGEGPGRPSSSPSPRKRKRKAEEDFFAALEANARRRQELLEQCAQRRQDLVEQLQTKQQCHIGALGQYMVTTLKGLPAHMITNAKKRVLQLLTELEEEADNLSPR